MFVVCLLLTEAKTTVKIVRKKEGTSQARADLAGPANHILSLAPPDPFLYRA
jgi:hypothetical protein